MGFKVFAFAVVAVFCVQGLSGATLPEKKVLTDLEKGHIIDCWVAQKDAFVGLAKKMREYGVICAGEEGSESYEVIMGAHSEIAASLRTGVAAMEKLIAEAQACDDLQCLMEKGLEIAQAATTMASEVGSSVVNVVSIVKANHPEVLTCLHGGLGDVGQDLLNILKDVHECVFA